MEMQHCDYFDYWGSGTQVTVQSGITPPALFPLIQCQPESTNKITVGCLARDFSPNYVTFKWTDASGSSLTTEQHSSAGPYNGNQYTGVSVLQVLKADWDSRKSFNCSVTHYGSSYSEKIQKPAPAKVTLLSVPSEDTQALVCILEDGRSGKLQPFKWKKGDEELNGFIQYDLKKTGDLYSAVSVLKVEKTDWDSEVVYTCEATYRGNKYIKKTSKAPITVTLNQPRPKTIFSNNQAELSCVIAGQDKITVDQTEIKWQIDGQTVTSNDTEMSSDLSKTSKLTLSYAEWQKVNRVSCSASTGEMTPVIQELTLHKGDGSKPNVKVHILPEKHINQGAEVTLVCLVSSRVLQNYYIAWSEAHEKNLSNYADGINFSPQKTQHGYSVASVYTTTKEKWEKKTMFVCHVWSIGSNEFMTSNSVSTAMDFPSESQLSFALSCIEDATEEDEFSSLWSTTSSFIFLFITSLFYNMIFSLVKMKRQ